MQKIGLNKIGVAQGQTVLFSDFEHDGAMWTGEGPRETRVHVLFDEPFAQPPAVHAGLSMWDISNASNTRADVSCEEITTEGFAILFRTWGDTRVARARVGWIAIGAVRDEDDWDVD